MPQPLPTKTADLLRKVARLLSALLREYNATPVTKREIQDVWCDVSEHLEGADCPEDN